MQVEVKSIEWWPDVCYPKPDIEKSKYIESKEGNCDGIDLSFCESNVVDEGTKFSIRIFQSREQKEEETAIDTWNGINAWDKEQLLQLWRDPRR